MKGGRRRRPRRARRFRGHLKQRDVGSSKLGGVARHGSARRPVHAGWLISWLHPEDIDRARGVHTRAPPPADADSHPLSRVAARPGTGSRCAGISRSRRTALGVRMECLWAPPRPRTHAGANAAAASGLGGGVHVHHRDVRCTRTRDTALNDVPLYQTNLILLQ